MYLPNVREIALKVFFDLGFVKESEYVGKKFGKDEIVYSIEKDLKLEQFCSFLFLNF